MSGTSPTGQVRFSEGATVLGTVNLSSGAAHFTTAALPAGTHTFTSEYLGDGNHNGSSSNGATATVSQGGAGAIVYSSNANSLVGQSVTFTGAVNGLSTFPATGTVTFLDGTVSLGTGTLANGSATFTTSALSAGSHAITAAYSGDNSYPPITSAPLTQQVSAQASGVTLTVPLSPLMGGRKVLLSAAVTGSSPTGTGQFLDKGVVIAQASVANGVASTSVKLKGGDRVLTAHYLGDANNAGSTSAQALRFVDISNIMVPIYQLLFD